MVREIKRKILQHLYEENGFAPLHKNISILKVTNTGDVDFRINGYGYRLVSQGQSTETVERARDLDDSYIRR